MDKKSFNQWNRIVATLVLVISGAVYLSTIEPTASFWDCGEFIASSYKLEVGHPPGNPVFQLIARFFTIPVKPEHAAVAVNAMNAILSALTIFFLYLTTVFFARRLVGRREEYTLSQAIAIFGSGVVGALAYCFSDTFWFSAVEGEVYAMSSLFTALVFWAMCRWYETADEPHANRWIVLIAFLMGLSIGVHLLNLLTIPAFVFLYYYRKNEDGKLSPKQLAGVFLIGVVIEFVLVYLFIPYLPKLAAFFDRLFVNGLGLPYNSGALFFMVALLVLCFWSLFATLKKGKVFLNTVMLCVTTLVIGFSLFSIVIIRSSVKTPTNEYQPDNAYTLVRYLSREQYGSTPLLYGQYYDAPYDLKQDKYWAPLNGKYIHADSPADADYLPEGKMLFPRMWSSADPRYVDFYETYTQGKGKRVKGAQHRKPTFGANLRYFFDYQLNWMYWRYFMWNFVGRQNDIESQGELNHGNWISGISAIDNARLGNQDNIPTCLQNSGRTTYYFLPLLLGLIGLFWLLKNDLKQSWIIFLLFFMTGLAIVIYLNQTPQQPRERDYSYAGSFYAFAIWIGFGVIALIDMVSKLTKKSTMITTVAVGLACFLAVPCVLASNGWKEHNRSGKTSARDWARNYLAQLPPNAVIFTRGDNDTFPLWYVQEVEGFRTDVRVCNYMLSGGYWYVHQMGRKVYESEKLPLTLTPKEYDNGINEQIPVEEEEYFKGKRVELKQVIDFIHNPKAVKRYVSGTYNYVPCRSVKLTVDKEACLRNGIVPESMKDRIVDEITWEIKGDNIYKAGLMLLDFMATNNWERPVYFTSFSDMSSILGIDKYLHMEGLAYRFIPVEAEDYIKIYRGGVYRDGSYSLLVTKANEGIVNWGNMNQEGVVPDRESMRELQYAQLAYSRLAQALVNHGQLDSAVIVMDKFQEFFPNEKFPAEIRTYMFPEMYYVCGDTVKGDDYIMKLVNNYCDKIKYYGSMKPKFRQYYEEDLDEGMSLLKHFGDVAKRYQRTEISETISDRMMEYLASYYGE